MSKPSLSRRHALRAIALAGGAIMGLRHQILYQGAGQNRNRRRNPSRVGSLTIQVLTMNCWGLWHVPDRVQRIEAIAAAISSLDVDIVSLQECWVASDRDTLIDRLTSAGLPYYSYFHAGGVGNGLMLFSRFRIDESQFVPYALNGDPATFDFYATKGFVVASVETPLGPLDIYHTHAIAQHVEDGLDPYLPDRASQMFQLAQSANRDSASRPTLALGDFNSRPDQLPYRVLTDLGKLTDSYAAVHGGVPASTYSDQNPYVAGRDEGMLDYIMSRSGAEIEMTPLSSDIVFKEIPGEAIPYSDHYGVLATIQLQAGGSASGSDATARRVVLATLRAVIAQGLQAAEIRLSEQGLKAGGGAAATLALYIGRQSVKESRVGIRAGVSRFAALTSLYTLVQGWRIWFSATRYVTQFKAILAEIDATADS